VDQKIDKTDKSATPKKIEMWDNYRSFYFSNKGEIKLDFSDHIKKDLSLY